MLFLPGFPCGFHFFQQIVKAFMAGFPEFAIAFGPVGNVFKVTRFESAEMLSAARGFGDETGALEISEVFGDSLLGDTERAGKLIDRGGALCEAEEYGAARRVREGGEGDVKIIHNHMVVDCDVAVKGIFCRSWGLRSERA
jgi:hypothetical protein